MSLNYGVLLSGGGTNFQAIADHIAQGVLPGKIVLVISNKESAYGLVRAKKMNIPALAVKRKEYISEEAYYEAVGDLLEEKKVDYIFLAGFIRILPESFVHRFEGRILNIHPSLIPKYCGEGFYGERVHQAVVAAGELESGATVHFVDAGCDTGKIILQEKVPVYPEDTWEDVASRVLNVEHEIYTKAILKVIKEDGHGKKSAD